jgi:IS5 family transposase
VAQNRNPSRKNVRKAIGKQLRYLRRNIGHINKMLDSFEVFPLPKKLQKQYWVIQTLYDQQWEMFTERKHRVDDRIVSIHQPHVCPIVRGKAGARVEFGSKLHLSLVNGFAFVDTISWDAYNEGTHLMEYVENYKCRFGFYPEKVLVDKIYCTRANRRWLKERQIKLAAKPLGGPSAKAVEDHVRPGERNPIEDKFGQAKNGCGMNRIRARLKQTSQSWIASSF